jgi:uncharacterized membrane protein
MLELMYVAEAVTQLTLSVMLMSTIPTIWLIYTVSAFTCMMMLNEICTFCTVMALLSR